MSRLPIALAAVLVLGGCVAVEDAPAPSPTVTTAAAQASTPVTVGDLTLFWDAPADATPVVDEDGAVTLTVTDTLLITTPEGTAPERLADDGVLIRDSAGTPVAGISATGLTATVQDRTIAYRVSGDAASVTLSTVAIRDAHWAEIDDEGGRSLAVTPSAWARHGGLAVDALLWAQLIAAQPEADTQGMHDQLTCHQVGAPEKDSWNLEPWRPEVGLVQTMLARCNPA